MDNFVNFLDGALTENTSEQSKKLPMLYEMGIDFKTGETISVKGDIVIVSGIDAVLVWVYKSLKTERKRYKAYSGSFGNDLNKEIGFVYDRNVKSQLIQAEIIESLMVNPYITRVYDFELTLSDTGDKLSVGFYLDTIYGKAKQEVDGIVI
ncbi:MAG: DUF2634 domain-containing protein [Cetobacterium sp.]|uniref:DUF2634 domain-containing protein n=1 Tax=Cetobacterium sp. TaxID=2071632 RepID=UPI003F3768C9